MKTIYKSILVSAFVSGASLLQAQTTYSGYFLENYAYRFQMNPAVGNEKGFVSFPVLGNLNINLNGNLNLQDVVYSRNGKTMLFTNPEIPVSEAMSRFGKKNRLGSNDKIDILTIGFKGFKGYNTISLSAVANLNVSVPGSFFSLAKEGITNKTYDVENLFGNANAYMQFALNHSHDIKAVPGLRIGATLKVLAGAGNVDINLDKANLELGTDNWIARTNADIYTSIKGFTYDHSRNDKTGKDYVSGGDIDTYGLSGIGGALDLGAEYQWKDFKFSLAVLDLGFMRWGDTAWASTNGVQTVETNAFTFNADGDAPNSFKKEWERLEDNISELYQLTDNGVLPKRTRSLGATLNTGVQYSLPTYKRLKFGLLNSTKIDGKYTWTQFRLSANICPVNFLSANINAVAGTYGTGLGWLFNIHTTGFNLFFGMDHTVGTLSKQFVPLKSNNSFNFGMDFPF